MNMAELNRMGIRARADAEGKLILDAPAGALTPELLEELRQSKAALLVELAGNVNLVNIVSSCTQSGKETISPPTEVHAPAKVGAGDTAMVEPFDREAFEGRAAICEFDVGPSRADAESFAWHEDDRRRCTQCLNRRPHDGVCRIAEPKAGALVAANRSYAPDPVLPRRCEGYAPKASDPDQRPGADRWPGLIQKGGE